jgi:hypothetical protein
MICADRIAARDVDVELHHVADFDRARISP